MASPGTGNLSDIANQVISTCSSTNDLARRLGEAGYSHGTWVSCLEQSGGRGRLGREWKSAHGNLHLSLVARVARKELWTWVPLATALAVVQTLSSRFPGICAKIKWPNDIWVAKQSASGQAWAKLGGILCEGVAAGSSSFIIVGIGLNCVSSPEGLDQAAASLSELLPSRVTADQLRQPLIEEFLDVLHGMDQFGQEAIKKRYLENAVLTAGVAVEWGECSGTVLGLGESGELEVLSDDGKRRSLFAEDVRVRLKG